MKTNHTKGEWEVADYIDINNGKRSLAVWVGQEKTICLVSPKETEDEEDLANAKLIAAAPELLETLLKVKQYFLEIGCNGAESLYESITNSIQKATE